MATPQLLNSVDGVVDDCLAGLVASQPSLALVEGHRVVVRADIQDVLERGHVTLVSGGGSGHEPSHAGFVGRGMLSAAVAGNVFASPPSSAILAAILAVAGRGGVLVVIKNYTGDRLHFGLAVERARGMGHSVRLVVMADDMAFDSDENTAGRRGLAGALFVHKVCGALAEEGKSLDEVHAVAERIIKMTATIGVSLSPCCLPGRGPSFQLPDGVMELGLGIHGEAGLQRTKVVSADETVAMMADRLFKRNMFAEGDHVALIVNNLGGLSNLELGVVTKAAIEHLEGTRKLHVDRVACGALMTSINMAGFSLSLVQLDATVSHGLGYEIQVACWPSTAFQQRIARPAVVVKMGEKAPVSAEDTSQSESSDAIGRCFSRCMRSVCEKLTAAEHELDDLDRAAGDGDCGSTFKQGAQAVTAMLDSGALPVNRPAHSIVMIASKLEEVMGGTSGALYTLMLTRVAHTLRKAGGSDGGDATFKTMRDCVDSMIDVIGSYGGAKRGDRTMLDALYGAQDALNKVDASAFRSWSRSEVVAALTLPVEACRASALATQSMRAGAGRASYVSADHWTKPDAGATAVAIWVEALLEPLAALLCGDLS